MRILHVIGTMAPSAGGPTTVLLSLTAAQSKIGIQAEICTTNRGHPTSMVLDLDSMKSALDPSVPLYAFPTDVPALLVSRTMRRWLRQNIRSYDLLISHGLYRFPQTYAAHLARRYGVPYVISPHGSLDPFLHQQSSRSVWLKRLWEHWLDLPNLQAATAIQYTTEDERERASFLNLQAPSFVVPNGLDWGCFAQLPQRGAFRARLGIGDLPLVLFLSRLNFKKGLDLLVPAFARVRAEHPQAVLAIVGPDNDGYGEKVRAWVSENGLQECVHFVDHLQGEAVLQAYVDADVFALPSYTENFGMVVAESLACGTPVVISDQVNIHGEVAAAGAGLVTRCDVTEVATAISTLLQDTPRRQAMGLAGRDLVRRKWTWDVVARDLSAEYERIIAEHRAQDRAR